MKDFLGQELKIGDSVIYPKIKKVKNHRLSIGKVIKFSQINEKDFIIINNEKLGYFPRNVIKINLNLKYLKYLKNGKQGSEKEENKIQ